MSDPAIEIRFEPSGKAVEVTPGTTLIAATKSAGLSLGAACDSDLLCGLCMVRILAGLEHLSAPKGDEVKVLKSLRATDDERLACRARVEGPVTLTADYW